MDIRNNQDRKETQRSYHAVRHTACRSCDLDIEGFAPYRKGEWRDRGNNGTCPHGENKDKPHAPVRPFLD